MRTQAHSVAGIFLTVCLAACGGGGGSLEPEPEPQPEPEPTFPDLALVEIATGFVQPTTITHADDGSDRLFVVERRGTVRIVDGDVAASVPFLDLLDRVTAAAGEQGLLGLAFAPDYADSGHLYVNYTDLLGDTVIARFTADADTVDVATEQVLLRVEQPFANHNGGQLAFGPDGYLYIALGDGGSSGDPQGHAQNLDSLLGKLLRLDVSDPDVPYVIPEGNPFGDEIWAYGLRNPWRFSFDQATGNLYIADVGQSLREEVNVQAAASPGGENYGWNVVEGTQCYAAASCDAAGFTAPVHEYDHSEGCSITGGQIVDGVYVFSDFCSGTLWGLQRVGTAWLSETLLATELMISTFGVGEDGAVYLADYGSGVIWRINVNP